MSDNKENAGLRDDTETIVGQDGAAEAAVMQDEGKKAAVMQGGTSIFPGILQNLEEDTRAAKYTAKDSVFTDMLRNKKYLLQLYRALHPEDIDATEDSLTNITINHVLVNGQYNDVGFLVNDKLVILVEEQSSVWTMNIIVRALFYIDQTLQIYLDQRGADLYGRTKVSLPETELYVLYVGKRRNRPTEITLKKEFYKNRKSAIDVEIKMLYGTVHPEKTEGEDIVGQYVLFTKVYNEQVRLHGRTVKAVSETIKICMERNILREYLGSRKQEVVTMMMDLYNQDRILEIHIASEKRIAAEKATKRAEKKAMKAMEEAKEEAKRAKEEVKKEKEEARRAKEEARKAKDALIERMIHDGELSAEKIAVYTDVTVERVREIEAAMLQDKETERKENV